MKKCDVCGKQFSSKFCPECGRKYDDITVKLPIELVSYVHSDKDSNYDIIDELGIDPKSKLSQKIIYLNYEVKLVYEIIGDDILLKQVDAGDGEGLLNVVPIKPK